MKKLPPDETIDTINSLIDSVSQLEAQLARLDEVNRQTNAQQDAELLQQAATDSDQNLRLAKLEDKVAGLTPCPDQQDPEPTPPTPDPETPTEPEPEPLQLVLSTNSVAISVDEGLNAQAVQIGIISSGDGILQTPQISAGSQPWVSATSISGADPTWVANLAFDTAALAPGIHQATVQISAPNAVNSPKVLQITLTVVDVADPPPPPPDPEDPKLESDPDEIDFSVVEGATPVQQSILLYRVGNQSMSAPVIQSTTDPDGIIGSATVVVKDDDEWFLRVTHAAKSAGTYTASITLASPEQTNPAIVIPVTLVVTTAAVPLTFSLSQSVLNLSVLQGLDHIPANIVLQAAGDGTLDTPTAGTPSSPWLSAVNISGSAPTWQAQLVFDTDALAVGAHSLTVDFSATNGTNNPRTLTINLTVQPNIPTPPSTTYKGATLPVGDQQIAFNAGTRVFDNTVMVTDGFTFGGTVHMIPAGDFTALQAAANAAVAGDIIQLVPGSTYTGTLVWPAGKTGYVKIRSGTMAGLPSAGQRVFPSDIPNMATIRCPNITNSSAIVTAQGAKYLYMEGINIGSPATARIEGQIVLLKSTTSASEADYPERFIFDRCVGIGRVDSAGVRRIFRADARYVAWLDCYLGETGQVGSDAQAIYTQEGGPFKFINCSFSAVGEAILTGATATSFAGAHVRDCEFRRCEFTMQQAWVDAKLAQMKNLFESKGIKRALFEGCLFHRNPSAAQSGFFFLLTNYDHNGRDEYNLDVVVYGCKARKVGAGFNQLNSNARQNCHGRIVYDQIVLTELGVPSFSGDRRIFQFLRASGKSEILEVTIEHVTAYTPNAIACISMTEQIVPIGQNLKCKNNLISRGTFGITKGNLPAGHTPLGDGWLTYTFTKNGIIGGNLGGIPAGNLNNLVATDVFVDPVTDLRVKGGSVAENAADDGADLGADIDFVEALTAGCETGTWP